VPSEYSSGTSRIQGSITKTGNTHVRRILVESAWCYRYSARLSRPVVQRQLEQPKAVRFLETANAIRKTAESTLPASPAKVWKF